ncbi:MAG: bacteriohopanetetrol glucosamine biosynthesis glycosyltransferase HpnI, partial [Terriglobia bacterium]
MISHHAVLVHDVRDIMLCAPFAAYLYYSVAAVCAVRFFNRTPPSCGGFAPAVSVLKPVSGVDREAYENFSSFCRLDYPAYELLFGVSNQEDPVIPIIQRLIRDFPERSIRLFTDIPKAGANDKASVLACLSREANHELLVISDSDTRVEPGYLRAMVRPFSDPQVGVVTCLYRGTDARTMGDSMEAIGISSDFFAGAIVADQFGGARFALGASMAVARAQLAEIGGFEELSEFLLDDFELGNRVAALGYRVELLPYAVSMVLPSESLRGFWQRQVRWAVGIRNTSPAAHWGLLLTQGLPLTLLAVTVCRSAAEAGFYGAAYLLTRYSMAFSVGVWGLQDSILRRRLWLAPVRDAAGFLIWLASFPQSRVSWRGK